MYVYNSQTKESSFKSHRLLNVNNCLIPRVIIPWGEQVPGLPLLYPSPESWANLSKSLKIFLLVC